LTVELGIEKNIKNMHLFTKSLKFQSTIVFTIPPLIAASFIDR